ncbi:MAG TPA: type II secretion system protein [Pyrinomonadaceae bacterium]|nr:type II secretion system protein [Pyrinomonadaceae bacterium]
MNNLSTSFTSKDKGFSVIELLIVVAMVGVVSGYALLQIAEARQSISRVNAAHEFLRYIEKARLDSVRRHVIQPTQMGQVTIINSNFYTVTLDTDGDGILDDPRVITLPANSGLSFNGPFPRTIMFNWRGRTVDATNNIATPATVTISNSYGSSAINISSAGQTNVDTAITADPVSNSIAPAANFRGKTQITP